MDYDALMASWRSAEATTKPSTRRVIGWVSTHSIEGRDLPDVGGWGGDIEKGDRWKDYIALVAADFVAYHEGLRREILARSLRRGGDWHQYSLAGVPVFNDGAIGTFSFRAWGDLMAAIWADVDGRDYSYMDFYMDSCVEDLGIALSPPRDP